jgi:hypothetical protein
LPPRLALVSEVEWEPGSLELSGCYRLSIERGRSAAGEPETSGSWLKGESYAFGIQVRVFETHLIDGQSVQVPVDWGQIVLQINSLGT